MNSRTNLLTAFAMTLMVSLASAKTINNPTKDLDMDSVVYIEEDHNLELGFDTAQYLPENFDPYSGHVSVDYINYIDECDEIELGFDTAEYLPVDYDPYVQ